jgi:DNA-binding ferritin-like protein
VTSRADSIHLPALEEPHQRAEVGGQLQTLLVELVYVSQAGNHLHWNVLGPLSSPPHVELDEMVDSWRELAHTVAEGTREKMDRLGDLDAASQALVIEVGRAPEKQLWMTRAQSADEGRH